MRSWDVNGGELFRNTHKTTSRVPLQTAGADRQRHHHEPTLTFTYQPLQKQYSTAPILLTRPPTKQPITQPSTNLVLPYNNSIITYTQKRNHPNADPKTPLTPLYPVCSLPQEKQLYHVPGGIPASTKALKLNWPVCGSVGNSSCRASCTHLSVSRLIPQQHPPERTPPKQRKEKENSPNPTPA
jgi:hypothetical protein